MLKFTIVDQNGILSEGQIEKFNSHILRLKQEIINNKSIESYHPALLRWADI
jgi:hypothetical protein